MTDIGRNEGEFFLPEEFLSDDFFTTSDEENPKDSTMGAPPPSPPRGMRNLSFSRNGSPDGLSPTPSPPLMPFTQPGGEALDLLYAAVDQVERLHLNGQNPSKNRNSLGCFYPNQELVRQQLQAARFYQLKRQQLMKMQQQHHANAVWELQQQSKGKPVRNAVNALHPSPSDWPPLQKQQGQQPGSGMTAVFLNGAARRQSNGTGVFLPRRVGGPTEPKKKQNCSTVLLPARVLRVLNLNVEDIGVCRPRMSGCYALGDNDAPLVRSNVKRNHFHNRQAAVLGLRPETWLPQEWTY